MEEKIKLNEVDSSENRKKGMKIGTPEYAIVVADNRFVYSGLVTLYEDQIFIEKCINLRQWGTEEGLGELALGKISSSAIFDHAPDVTFLRDGYAYHIIRFMGNYDDMLKHADKK